MSLVDSVVRRFVKLVNDGADSRKLQSVLISCSKKDFMAWTDENGQDALHHAVLADNAEAVDLLLKLHYFSLPYEPKVNMYAHLAARVGHRAILCIILQHRPSDFKVAHQPLKIFKSSSINVPVLKHVSSRSFPSSSMGGKLLMMNADLGVNGGCFSQQVEQGDSGVFHVQSRQESFGSLASCSTAAVVGISAEKHRRCSQIEVLSNCARRESFPTKKKQEKKAFISQTERRNSSPEESGNMFDKISLDLHLECTPLDIAAHSKHMDCVKTLLDMYVQPAYPELSCYGYLTLAVLANSVASLKLLLRDLKPMNADPTPEPSRNQVSTLCLAVKKDYQMAVELCLQNVFPACLEALLKTPLLHAKRIFQQVNFFHVMFSQPVTTYKRMVALSRMPTLTDILIRLGHDVMAKTPPRTYPLYTIIYGAFSCTDFSFGEELITCMVKLLIHGADPNFDELMHEKSQEGFQQPMVSFDIRPAFSSALHCAIKSVEIHKDKYCNKSQVLRFAEECVGALIARGADIWQVGHIQHQDGIMGDVLCQLAKCSVSIGLEKGLLRILLRYGAEPQRKINGMYALNVYLDEAYHFLSDINPTVYAVKVAKLNEDVSKMIILMCSHMSPSHIRDIRKIFKFNHRCTDVQMELVKQYVEKVDDELKKEEQKVHTLRSITAWRVWKMCNRSSRKILKLRVPYEFKQHVLPLLLFQSFW